MTTETEPALSKEEPPLQPWAKARTSDNKKDDDPVLSCFPPGMPRILLGQFPFEIIQIPGRVIMIHEYGHFVRQIFTDGRSHPKDIEPSWMGHSVGKWDGNVLVADTIGFNDKTWLDSEGHPHSDELHLVERIHRVDHDTLVDELTIEDPKTFTHSWTGRIEFKLNPQSEIKEQVCEDSFLKDSGKDPLP